MSTTPSSLTWNLNPNTSLTKGILWTGTISPPVHVTANIDPNPNGVFTVISISTYVTIHTPGGSGGKFPAIITPVNPSGRAVASGEISAVTNLVKRVEGGASPLFVGLDEQVVVEVSADASKGIPVQGQNETIGTLNILGLPEPVSVPLVLDICQADTKLQWNTASGSSNPASFVLNIPQSEAKKGTFQGGSAVYGVGNSSMVTLAPPNAGISPSNPLTFWVQQWGAILDSGLDSQKEIFDTPLYPNTGDPLNPNNPGHYDGPPLPVGFPYPYVPLQFIKQPEKNAPVSNPFSYSIDFAVSQSIPLSTPIQTQTLFFLETQFNGDIQNWRQLFYRVI
jgi:hypothetical protein